MFICAAQYLFPCHTGCTETSVWSATDARARRTLTTTELVCPARARVALTPGSCWQADSQTSHRLFGWPGASSGPGSRRGRWNPSTSRCPPRRWRWARRGCDGSRLQDSKIMAGEVFEEQQQRIEYQSKSDKTGEDYVGLIWREASPALRKSLDSASCWALALFLGDDLRKMSFSSPVAVALSSGFGVKQVMMKPFATSDMHSGTLGWILNMPTLMGFFFSKAVG